jgi:hypothetical protein
VVSVPLASTRYCTTQTSFYDSKDFQGTSIRLQFWAAKGKRVTEFWEWTEWLLARTQCMCTVARVSCEETESGRIAREEALFCVRRSSRFHSTLGSYRISQQFDRMSPSVLWAQGHVQGAINLDWLGPANYSKSSPPEQTWAYQNTETLSGFIPPPTLSRTAKLQDSNMEYLWGETS